MIEYSHEKQKTIGGVVLAEDETFTLPSDVISFTVSAQFGSFDISFDGGLSYPLINRSSSRTWGDGTIERVRISNSVVIKSKGDVDIIWETI